MQLLENEIRSRIMTINWLQKFNYIDIFKWLWPKIIGDDILCQKELSIIYAYIWVFSDN
jgi:hypothetical protein